MREPERDYGRLQDIIQAADHIAAFTEGYSQEQLMADKLRYFAVVKNVEIIGEAAFMLSREFKEKHSQMPWNDIIRMRHVLVHGYATILPELLWQTALVDVPILKKQVEAIVNSLPDN
jgi:uncharacterized protein with HEPN domain